MTEHTRVGTELIAKIEKLIKEHDEGFVKVYFDKNNELDTNWYPSIGDMDIIVERETYSETKERFIVTFDVRKKPIKQDTIVGKILVKVNLGEKNGV